MEITTSMEGMHHLFALQCLLSGHAVPCTRGARASRLTIHSLSEAVCLLPIAIEKDVPVSLGVPSMTVAPQCQEKHHCNNLQLGTVCSCLPVTCPESAWDSWQNPGTLRRASGAACGLGPGPLVQKDFRLFLCLSANTT